MNSARLKKQYEMVEEPLVELGVAAASDGSLMRAASAGDPDAFRLVFDRHHRSVWRFLATRYGREPADDLAAETFARAFAARGRFDTRRADVRPWLFGIALNVGRAHHRLERTQLELARYRGGTTIELDTSPLDARGSIAKALLNLEERDREALLLFALADLTYGEIAEATGVPEGTVRSRLNRARRLIKEALA